MAGLWRFWLHLSWTWPAKGLLGWQVRGCLGVLSAPLLSWMWANPVPHLPLLSPAAANMNLDRIGEQAEAMFGVG